jgi:putative chitinase
VTVAFLDHAVLKRLWPHAPAALVDAVASHSQQVFTRYGVNTPLRVAHFMAQVSHESSGGTITSENMNYRTAQRIAAVWPTRFTPATAQEFVGNPRKLASKVYNGRMGNRSGTEDGYTFRGRGLLQLTGRAAYADIGKRTGLDLVNNPDQAFAPATALEVAACEFAKLGCLPACDTDSLRAVTKRVNGGYIGLDSRRAWLTRWKQALPDLPGDAGAVEDNEHAPRAADVTPDVPVPPVSTETAAGTSVGSMMGAGVTEKLQEATAQIEPLRETFRWVGYGLAAIALISVLLTLYALWHHNKVKAAR